MDLMTKALSDCNEAWWSRDEEAWSWAATVEFEIFWTRFFVFFQFWKNSPVLFLARVGALMVLFEAIHCSLLPERAGMWCVFDQRGKVLGGSFGKSGEKLATLHFFCKMASSGFLWH